MERVKLLPEQERMMDVARLGLMSSCPFYSYYYFAEMEDFPTLDVPTAATDGRRIFFNPAYLETLNTQERVFVLAHEIDHVISKHPQRAKSYIKAGKLRGLDFDPMFFNVCLDLPINAGLIDNRIGQCNKAWLYDPDIKAEELGEDIYEKHWRQPPPQPQNGGGTGHGQPGQQAQQPTYGQSSPAAGKTGRADKAAQAAGGAFDQVLEPQVDPVTGREDLPSPAEFREAVARAAAAAKAIGKMPGSLMRKVEAILEPQVDWREHVRMLITRHIGDHGETWTRPNRRRLVTNPLVIMPGRAGHGADAVACVVDNSGSIGERELSTLFSEIGGILADVKPKRVILIWCDAAVRQVDEAETFDDLAHIRAKGSPGGGGTSFIPPFEWLAEHEITPDTLIYLTDMMGGFPDKAPSYPVVWCATTDLTAPWGETVRVNVKDEVR